MVAGVGVVEDEDVQPRVLAGVVVAAGAPVLPLPHLETRVTCHVSRGVRCEVTWTQLRSSHMVSVWSKHLLPSPYDSSAKLRSSPGSTRTLFIFIASLEPVSAFYSGDNSDMLGTTLLLRMMGRWCAVR